MQIKNVNIGLLQLYLVITICNNHKCNVFDKS